MRTADLIDDDGRKFGFYVSNLLLSRLGAAKIVKRIPGVTVTKARKPWHSPAGDDFCHFTLNGHRFIVLEPPGSGCYWILPQEPEGLADLETVERVFVRRGFLGRISR